MVTIPLAESIEDSSLLKHLHVRKEETVSPPESISNGETTPTRIAMTLSPSKGPPDSSRQNPILKKVIPLGEKPTAMLVVLHESIVRQFHIDEQCWLEEIPTSEGILLKIRRTCAGADEPRQ